MDTIVSLSPRIVITEFLAVCAGISCVAAAVGWVVKVVKLVGRPARKTNERLTAIENTLAAHEDYLSSDKTRLEAIEAGTKVTQKAILALLAHGIDGNDIEAMKRAKDELQEYLIERR